MQIKGKQVSDMWKKFVILALSFIGLVTSGYAYYVNQLEAATAFQLQKGQKVIIGSYNGKEVVWDIGNATNDYVLMSSKPIENMSTYDSNKPIAYTPKSGSDREQYCIRFTNNPAPSPITYCPITPIIKSSA